jgi:hypothetical protein
MKPIVVLLAACSLSLAANAFAQTEPVKGLQPNAPSLAFNLGLIQPIALGGANVEVDFRVGHFVASYSHGWNLTMEGAAVVGDMKTQHVNLHLPFSTGFGVGVTFHVDALRSFFDLRFEGKIHRFDAYYLSADGSRKTAISSYDTFTLGGGAYWTLVPFSHRTDVLKGIDISTSFRVWPNVASTLSGDQIAYANATTNRTETHQAANVGIANTPIVANVSIGYVFQ